MELPTKDIENREDVELMVNSFYQKVQNNEHIGPFFNDVMKVNWDEHLPRMYKFWENALFHTGGYMGNVMQKHKHVNQQQRLQKEHFDTWLRLFEQNIKELFVGKMAEQAIIRAKTIAVSINHKLNNPKEGLL